MAQWKLRDSDDIVSLAELREMSEQGQDLDTVLRGARLHHQSRSTSTRDEIDPTRLRTQAEAEERAYQSLLSTNRDQPENVHQLSYEPVPLSEASAEAMAHADKLDRSHISTIVNIIVTMAATAFGLWYWTRHNWSVGGRLSLSLFGALVLGVTETFLYVRYVQSVARSRKKEQAKEGKKEQAKEGKKEQAKERGKKKKQQ